MQRSGPQLLLTTTTHAGGDIARLDRYRPQAVISNPPVVVPAPSPVVRQKSVSLNRRLCAGGGT